MSIVKVIASRLRAAEEVGDEDGGSTSEVKEVVAMIQKALRTLRPRDGEEGEGTSLSLSHKAHIGNVINLLAKGNVRIDFKPAPLRSPGAIYGVFQGVRVSINFDSKGLCNKLDVYSA